MNRFKASKYKNSTAKVPKKELCISDTSVETPVSYGNHVSCGAKFFACNLGLAGGGKLGIFDVNDSGRKGQHPLLAAHAGIVTDIEFSPFFHDTLLSASDDCTVKIWKIPNDGISKSSSLSPETTFKGFKKRPEVLQHHPVAAAVCALSSGSAINILDMVQGTIELECEIGHDVIQSISWAYDGETIAATTKDKKICIIDPRHNKQVAETSAHGNHKDSRVISLGESGKFATTGFSTSRSQEIKAWDPRNLQYCLQTLEFGTSTGVLMPFYDVDAKLLFAAGKGECSLSILEFVDGSECITQASHTVLPEQSKGMGMLPKLAVDVMACEVDRLIQLCARQIVPVKIEVPRKSHRDFASDLYPDTDSDEVTLSAADWFSGKDGQRLKTSLDPSRRKSFSNPIQQPKPASAGEAPSSIPEQPGKVVQNDSITPSSGFKKVETEKKKVVEPELPKPTGRAFTVGQKSKFRHWIATTLHPATHVTNIPKLKMSLPGSCDGFHANHERAAVPLTTPGGHIAILELSKVGRLPTTSPPSVQNTSTITDMRWDPFNPLRLAVGLENAAIKVWDIPKGGLKEVASDASFSLSGHHNKIICLQFHPLASGILASASTDSTIIIWDLDTQEKCITLSGHEDEILHFAWSSDGKYIASMCKDSKIRIFEPRISTDPIKVTTGPEGSRGGRIAWTCGDQMLLTSGFSKNGNRQIAVYNVAHFDGGKIEDIELGASPSTLIPFYDEDSNVCFATGKGDTTVYSFEVSTEDPYLTGLNTFTNDQPHQSFSFLPKQNCDPRKVEFARAWCLKKTSLEPVSFKVPRVKMEYFQDDIFPDTRDLTKPSMTSQQWLDGDNKQATRISLRPSDMKPLSEAPKEAPKTKKYESYNAETYKTDEEKKEELLSAMSNKLDLDKELEQDTMEGVDEEEWDDY